MIAFTFYFALSRKPRQNEMILQGVVENSLFLLYSISVDIDFILAYKPWSGTAKNIKKSIQSKAQ